MEDTGLASELERLQALAMELGARVDDEGAPAAARELCGALAASVDRVIRLAAGSNGGNAGPGKSNGHPRNSCRKAGAAKVRMQVRVATVQDTGPLNDGLSWRKYGQKDILGAPYPRAYFRCTHRHTQDCAATKQVQRAATEPLLFDVLYIGAHTCAQQGAAPSLLNIPEQQPPASDQEEQGCPVATDAIRWPVEPVTPFAFPSSPGAIDGCYMLASSGSGSGYAAIDGLGFDMEYEPQLDELLFDPSELFQP